jgi:hypothetical protein
MTDSRTVDIHIGPYDYTNDIQANLGYHVIFPFLRDMLQTPEVRHIGIPVNQHLSTMPVTSLSVLFSYLVSAFRYPCDQITLCLARR